MAMEDLPPELPRDESPRDDAFTDVPPAEQGKDDRQWAMFAHLSAILTTYTLGMGFLGPLIIWLVKKDQSRYVDYHGKEALNFQLTVLIFELISIALVCVVVGIFLLIALGAFSLVMSIIAGLNANSGQRYRYPLTIRFVK
jgi:uncharacterized Tic20 family protein